VGIQLRYRPEVYPEKTLYVEDTQENQDILTDMLGENELGFMQETSKTYLVVNIETFTWYKDMAFSWLYRDPPPLVDVQEVIDSIKRIRRDSYITDILK